MNEEIKKYVDFLMEEAESISHKVKSILPKSFDELELIYCTSFIICDLLQAIGLSDKKHGDIVNEFLKKHLFMKTISILSKNPTEPTSYLNEKSVEQSDRMNEYKNSYPLVEAILKYDDLKVKKFVYRISKNICLNNTDVDSFSDSFFPILKEFSTQHINVLHTMEGRKPMTIIDLMIRAEEKIMQRIQKEIKDTANDEELYYYAFYLVNSFYEKLEFVYKKVESAYSTKSLNNYINTSLNEVENDSILKNRTKRYEDYEIMWNQIEHDEVERSSRMAMFFGFGSKYIYGNNVHMMTFTFLHPELISIMSESSKIVLNTLEESLNKKISQNKKPSLISRIKSLLK